MAPLNDPDPPTGAGPGLAGVLFFGTLASFLIIRLTLAVLDHFFP